MPEAVIPGVDVEHYYLESIVPISAVAEAPPGSVLSAADTLSLYLLDLMKMQEYRIVSGVRVEIVEPQGPVPYPDGWTVVRVLVDVQEYDLAGDT